LVDIDRNPAGASPWHMDNDTGFMALLLGKTPHHWSATDIAG
jgi:hypothetical protein